MAAGDIIGLVGSTAAAESSMGPHLHFSVAEDGVIIDPVGVYRLSRAARAVVPRPTTHP